MSKSNIAIVILCAVVIANPAAAATQKKSSSVGSIRVACLKQVGAQYRPGDNRWYFSGVIGTAQWQAFYDCLDRHTQKR